MTLDFTSLDKVVQRLQEGLARYQSDISDIQIRDGLTQRFEFTYELSHKVLRCYLGATPFGQLFSTIRRCFSRVRIKQSLNDTGGALRYCLSLPPVQRY